MTSNLFNRLTGGRSFYEDLHANDQGLPDEEQRVGFDVDEDNLNQNFHDYDIDHAEGLNDSRTTIHSGRDGAPGPSTTAADPWDEDDGDNEVPPSLLFEDEGQQPPPPTTTRGGKRNERRSTSQQPPLPGPSNKRSRAQWETTQTHQRLHRDETVESAGFGIRLGRTAEPVRRGIVGGSPKERTLYKWANVSDLDGFLHDVYYYYQKSGLKCILLSQALVLVQSAFTAIFLTFITQCVDYKKLPQSDKMSQIVIPKCTQNMSTIWNMILWVWGIYIAMRAMSFLGSLRRLYWVRDFYTHLLDILEDDMQTVSWQDIVARFMTLRDSNPNVATNLSYQQRRYLGGEAKQRVDAHDIANRLMRKDNYFIAMINKDLLDLSLPIPFLGKAQLYSDNLGFWLNTAIMDYVFTKKGDIRQEFLKADKRGQLSQKLKDRFFFYGVFGVALAPFSFFINFFWYIFMHFNDFHKNPAAAMGERAYTPLAMWKFREFNELEHLFRDRVNMSYPYASHYIDQFPKVKTEHVARSVMFISGAVLAVLAIATMVDPEMFLGFEITPDRTAIFYLGLFGGIYAMARGMISEESKVFNPELSMRQVIEYTHYMPDHWKTRLHSFDVKSEFSRFYKPRLVIFLEELLGIWVTPLVLLFSLPGCSDQIIDFFREFTLHVDGVGYVCTFAEFDFKKGIEDRKSSGGGVGDVSAAAAAAVQGGDVRDDYYSTKYGKMAASYYNFLDAYVWNPKTGMTGQHLGGRYGHGHGHGVGSQFHPPPSFPGLQSPTLAADMQASRVGGGGWTGGAGGGEASRIGTGGGVSEGGAGIRERGTSRPPAPVTKTPRFGPQAVAASPMASMLLDPHHQPHVFPNRAGSGGQHHPRTARSGYVGDEIIEEDGEGDESDVMASDRNVGGNGNSTNNDMGNSSVGKGFRGGGGGRGGAVPPGLHHEDSGPGGTMGNLDESVWETAPMKGLIREGSGASSRSEEEGGPGVLGLIQQLQYAHMDGLRR